MVLLDSPPAASRVLGRSGWIPGRPVPRDAADVVPRVASRVRELAGAWPVEAGAPHGEVWPLLAALGREDLAVARLVEGHVDAVRILAEAGRGPMPARDGGEAVYGVWASGSGGTGVTAVPARGGLRLEGLMRYCSGAWFLDRALIVARAPDGPRLLDIDVRDRALHRDEATWPAVGMDVTRSVDVELRGLWSGPGDEVGAPGFYLGRPRFAAGGVGVAAVWLGGAAGVLDAVLGGLAGRPANAHQRAHIGAMGVALVAGQAVLGELAALPRITATEALVARSAVEAAAGEVLRRAPRVTGPTPLCRDAALAHRLADLEVYVRQHHAEADLEAVGDQLLGGGPLLGGPAGEAS